MWYYKGQLISSIEQLPDFNNLMGFVYLITNLDSGAIYIGKKNFYTTRKTKLAKKDLIRKSDGTVNKGRKNYKHVTKESDWLKYWSSCDELQADVNLLGPKSFRREILQLSCSTKYLSYLELKYQLEFDVLNKLSYNRNIAGSYYRKDMEPCKLAA
jgi:hypothetical protein